MMTFERPLLLSKSIGEKESSNSSLKQHTTALCVPHMASVQCASTADGPPEILPDLFKEGSFSCQSTTSSSMSEGQERADARLGFFDALTLPNEPVTLRGGCSDYLSGLELPTHWPDEKEEIVKGPYNYLMSHPGKDIRKQVLSAFNVWLDVDDEAYGIIDGTIAMLHNASLLIDDIQDGSKLRRGSPVAHDIFGTAQTINSANYVYFLAQRELFRLKDVSMALQTFNEELLNLHRGQGMDLYWRDTLTMPSEEEYIQMISNKTGGLFRLSLKLMQAISKTGYDVMPLAEVIGLIFQIQDDYKNLTSTKMSLAKGYCEDLTEGKFSFPIIHAIRHSASGNNEILNVLRRRTDDDVVKAYAVSYIRDVTGSFDYTKEVLRRLRTQATDMMAAFDRKNPALEAILEQLVMT